VDGPPAEKFHDRVSGAAQGETALHDLPVLSRHLDDARVAQEVGGVQHVDVQRVAADPFPAVQQPAQVRDRTVHARPAGVFDCLAGTGLVGDGADAAHAGGDVGGLGVGATAQERLEEPGRLVDVEPDLVHPVAVDADIHGAFALDAGKPAGGERAITPVGHYALPG